MEETNTTHINTAAEEIPFVPSDKKMMSDYTPEELDNMTMDEVLALCSRELADIPNGELWTDILYALADPTSPVVSMSQLTELFKPQRQQLPDAAATTITAAHAPVPEALLPHTFSRVISAMHAQYVRKNHDYGNSFGRSVARYGAVSALTRMSDKWNRLESLILGENNQVSESLNDTLLDLATYCIMTFLAINDAATIETVIKSMEKENN